MMMENWIKSNSVRKPITDHSQLVLFRDILSLSLFESNTGKHNIQIVPSVEAFSIVLSSLRRILSRKSRIVVRPANAINVNLLHPHYADLFALPHPRSTFVAIMDVARSSLFDMTLLYTAPKLPSSAGKSVSTIQNLSRLSRCCSHLAPKYVRSKTACDGCHLHEWNLSYQLVDMFAVNL